MKYLSIDPEGAYIVRMSILELLTTKFNNLRIKEDEFIFNFNIHLRDIAKLLLP